MGENGDEEMEEEAQGEGRLGEQVRVRHDPGKPTEEEKRRHAVTHLPYRSWCAECVAGRGHGQPHLSREVLPEDAIPIIGMDYHYMGAEGEGGAVPMLVIKDAHTKVIFDFVVPQKGVDEYVVSRVIGALKSLGYYKVIIRSDQEVALQALVARVKEDWTGEVIIENSPVQQSASNGMIESGVRTMGNQIRTMKTALEKHYGEIGSDSPVVAWLVEHAAFLNTCFGIGRDGKEPYRLLKGRPWSGVLYEFGEGVQYKPLEKDKHRYKLDTRLLGGVFLGVNRRTGEYFIGTADGVARARDVYRRAENERWDRAVLDQVIGVPWNLEPNKEENEEDGTERPRAIAGERPGPRQGDEDGVEVVPRRMKITREDLEKYGYTQGCKGCIHSRLRRPARVHTDECRRRIEEKIKAEEEGNLRRARQEAAEHRQTEYIAKELERRDNERRGKSTDNGTSTHGVKRGKEYDRLQEEWEALGDQERMQLEDELFADEEPARKVRREGEDQQMDSGAASSTSCLTCPVRLSQSIGIMKELAAFGADVGRPLVSEVYSPPRVTRLASRYGLAPGTAFDLTTCDENGKYWDFDQEERRKRALEVIKTEEPILVIGSPMCTAFSLIQNLNKGKVDSCKVKENWRKAMIHLRFCLEIYQHQIDQGKYFLHEHPATATSWRTEEMINFMGQPEVRRVIGDMCMYGMTTEYDGKSVPAKKPTGWLSNCPGILSELCRRCDGGHEHGHLLGDNRARRAQVYPEGVCRAILRGLRVQLIADGIMGLNAVGITAPEEESMEVEDWEQFGDDITGVPLNTKKVQEARNEEIQEMKKRNIYTKVPVSECYEKTGKKPIGVKFVDVNKGDEITPNYRSRLVAKEFRDGAESIFAGTPPLEALKLLFSLGAAERGHRVLGFIDVKKAHLYAKATREVYVDLPPGDQESGMCGKLNYTLYGTRDAAQSWELEYSGTLERMGFKKGVSTGCVFRHAERDVNIVVHGDDFTILGTVSDIYWVKNGLEEKYELKMRGVMGPPGMPETTQEITILNRVTRWTGEGIEYEADPRHAEIIIKELGLSGGKTVSTPGCKKTKIEDEGEPMNAEESTKFRALVARANYLAQDRCDIQFAVKELTRRMSSPTTDDLVDLKRLGRYLLGQPRMIQIYAAGPKKRYMDCYVDSDWAGCVRTRRSTSGGGIFWGNHCIRTWASTQASVALSSGEAEFYSMVKGASLAIGMRSLMEEFGINVGIRMFTDSTAAKGIASRTGLGKTRHIAVHLLWIQEKVRGKDIELLKCKGTENPADLMTKHLDKAAVDNYATRWGLIARTGRSSVAPHIV